MKVRDSFVASRVVGWAVAALLFLVACHLTQEAGTEEVFTFPNLADTLQGSDSALILLKDTGGLVIDTLYHGPVHASAFTALPARHYRGGRAVVTIEAKKEGQVFYKVEKIYSGTSGIADSTLVIVARPAVKAKVESVTFGPDTLEVYAEGASEALQVFVLPLGANEQVRFSLADSTLAAIQDGKVRGLKQGETRIKVLSVEDTAKFDTLRLVVRPKPPVPVDSVSVSPDTLRLYTSGESFRLSAAIHPGTHDSKFVWHSAAPSIATVDSQGNVSPVVAGRAYVRARSLADSTRGDSCLVLVKKDVPRIEAGVDTTVSVGAILVFNPRVMQDYGRILKVLWDLDGDQVWDDSADAFKASSQQYPLAGVFTARFYALDSEGNDTLASRKITVVNGPAIHFQEPKDGAYTNQNPIAVSWTVDGTPKTSLDSLKTGANIISRSAKNGAGDSFSVSITVHYDTVAPAKPIVTGPNSAIAHLRPTWNWETGGGGNGTFRYRLDNANLATGTTLIQDTTFTPASNLTGGLHTLYVQERDAAGNWSPTGSSAVFIDITPPNAPLIDAKPVSPVASLRPVLKWSTGGNGGSGQFRYKIDNGSYSAYGSATSYQPPTQTEGAHVFYVQERDSLGNESPASSRRIILVEKGFLESRGSLNMVNVYATAFSPSGILHAAFLESDVGKVMYFSNGWRTLGNSPFSNLVGEIHSIAFSQDTLFVCYKGDEQSITVKKFRNGVWATIGENRIDSAGSSNDASLAISNDGIPYVCWITASETDIRVVRLNSTTNRWEPVGSGPVYHTADYWNRVSLAFNSSNEIHVAFNDISAGLAPTIKKLAGNSWVQVAQHPITSAHNLELKFHGNFAYLAYEQQGGATKTGLLAFTSAWAKVSEHTVAGNNPDLVLSEDGKPFFTTNSFDAANTVYIHSIVDGGLRSTALPAPTARPGLLAISPLGIPHVSFSDNNASEYFSTYKFGYDPE